MPRTLYDKIWDTHVVTQQDDGQALIYIDRHLLHEVSTPQAFEALYVPSSVVKRNARRSVRRPDCTLATVDHNIPTSSRKAFTSVENYLKDPDSLAQCTTLEQNVKDFGVMYFGMKDKRQGIVHVIGPEQGFTLPGITCVCGDSHTSTHGAFGCLAFGIGSTEVEHVLTTQTLLQKKSKNMRISVDGQLSDGVNSKDVILHIIGVIGTAGATGCVIEYAGSVVRSLSMEARMTMCNMSIEAGARAGMVAPDEVTFAYLRNRPFAPKGELWDRAVAYWRTLASDKDSKFDVEVKIDARDIVPTVTWGTSPQDVVPVTGAVPDPAAFTDPAKRASAERALAYMGLKPNTPMEDVRVDKVFIGSCTNSRIEDLRSAANVVLAVGSDARVAPNVVAMVVPGSGIIKKQAETEGLDAIFKHAGFEWREAGCSMCLAMNDDRLGVHERCASTSNRNFEGRQGPRGRTHLMSPAMAAATALTGKLTDVRKLFASSNARDVGGPKVPVSDVFQFLEEPVNVPAVPEQTSLPLPTDAPPSSDTFTKQFTIVKGIAVPLHIENIDTDMILPNRKHFLKTLKRTGLAEGLFYSLRFDPDTEQQTDFILNQAPFNKAKIIVCTGDNFGCGSSREHAPWSLIDFGIRSVIAPSFGEIFRNNAMQNGLLPVVLSKEECLQLAEDAASGLELTVDLENQEIRRQGSGKPSISFQTDTFRRHCLLSGLDDIALTLQKEDVIREFEERRSEGFPWLDGLGYPNRRNKVLEKVHDTDW